MRRNELHKILIAFVFASLILAMPSASAFKESGNGYNITGAIGRTGDTVSAGGYNLTAILLESPVVRETSPSYNTSLGWFYLVVEEDTVPSNITDCTTISVPGYYTLENDILDSGETVCINITASNVVFDGQGYTIDGTDISASNGIYAYGTSPSHLTNVTVNNVTVTDWYFGIRYYYVDDGTEGIVNTTASSNTYGIYLGSSDNNTIANNTATSNSRGIALGSNTNNNTLTNNSVSDNAGSGIYLVSTSSNTIYNNLFNNTENFYFGSGTYSNDWNTSKKAGMNVISGPYLGGNYWAYPNGTGFSETCTDADGDGICDLNYTLASGNVDYLPLTTFTVTSETFNITLLQGWNLISIPLEQANWSIVSVLAPIDGNYSVVFAYIDGGWKKSTAARNPLTDMSLEYGYWIYMTAQDTLELVGTVPPTTTINVSTGWNLAGYPSLATQNITDVLSSVNYSVVFAYMDGGWKKSTAVRNPLTEMSPGYGYWIYANEAGSYEV